MSPTQTPGVLRVGCLHSFIRCYHGWVWFGSPSDSNQRNGDWSRPLGVFIVLGCRGEEPECTGTLQSVCAGLPLIVWMDRLTGDPKALNCTVYAILRMHMCLCSSLIEKTFDIRWMNVTYAVTLQARSVCFFSLWCRWYLRGNWNTAELIRTLVDQLGQIFVCGPVWGDHISLSLLTRQVSVYPNFLFIWQAVVAWNLVIII